MTPLESHLGGGVKMPQVSPSGRVAVALTHPIEVCRACAYVSVGVLLEEVQRQLQINLFVSDAPHRQRALGAVNVALDEMLGLECWDVDVAMSQYRKETEVTP